MMFYPVYVADATGILLGYHHLHYQYRHFFQPKRQQRVAAAEARWALFTAKHNPSFLASDHTTKLFKVIFPDSEIAKSFASWHTKTAAVIGEALSPHFQKKVLEKILSHPFSILVDESNSEEDKSCITLVRYLDPDIGNAHTHFFWICQL